MALIGPVEGKSGVVCNYHRVIKIDLVDFIRNEIRFRVGMYTTKELRDLGKDPIQTRVYRIDLPATLPVYSDIRVLLYNYVLSLPEHGNLASDV